MIPSGIDVRVGGPSEGKPFPISITIGPKLAAVLALAVLVLALWALAKVWG